MPVALPALQSGLSGVASDPPPSIAECAQAWADAVQSYAAGVIPPSTTVAAAASALAGALVSAFGAPAAAPGMESAFAAFAATVGGGMAGWLPVPPPAPVGFATQFAGPKPATHAAAASAVASLIDAWFRTGTATLIAPPNTLVPWS